MSAEPRSAAQSLELQAPIPGIDQRVYDILIETCFAPEDGSVRAQFAHFWQTGGTEFRFIGSLGMGGKFWRAHGRWYVNCYRENETPDRLEMIEAADAKLAALKAKVEHV